MSSVIDSESECVYVVDGDTIDIINGNRLRLADINIPEIGENGYQEAKDYMKSLVLFEDLFIDYDDYGSMSYGRYICMVFIQYNSTHLRNVNLEMLESGYTELMDYTNNEFDPDCWELYIKYSEPEDPSSEGPDLEPYPDSFTIVILVKTLGLFFGLLIIGFFILYKVFK